MTGLEKKFLWYCKAYRLKPEREYRFHSTRRWRFDFAWPLAQVAVELEGGSWVGGAHTRGAGFAKDCEKYNAATEMGWRIIRLTSDMISAEAMKQIEGMVYEK